MQLDILSHQYGTLLAVSIALSLSFYASFFPLYSLFLVEEQSEHNRGRDRREKSRSLSRLLCSKRASILIFYDSLSLSLF